MVGRSRSLVRVTLVSVVATSAILAAGCGITINLSGPSQPAAAPAQPAAVAAKPAAPASQPAPSAQSPAPAPQPAAPAPQPAAPAPQPAAPTSQSHTYTDSGFGFAYGLYGLYVPGAAYVTPNPGTDTETLTTSSGVKTDSTLQLNADGTYVWNSAWDGRIIKGSWEKTGDSDYPILVRAGQEGKDWKLGKGDNSEIILWDGDAMTYSGDRAK